MDNMQMHTNIGDEGFVDDYLLYLMAQASAAISASFHSELAERGISVSKWRVLASLYPSKSLNVGDLARECLIKQSTLSRQLDGLVDEGLITRQHEKQDRRGVVVKLSTKGKRLAAKLVAKAKRHEQDTLRAHKAEDVDALKALLRDILRLGAASASN